MSSLNSTLQPHTHAICVDPLRLLEVIDQHPDEDVETLSVYRLLLERIPGSALTSIADSNSRLRNGVRVATRFSARSVSDYRLRFKLYIVRCNNRCARPQQRKSIKSWVGPNGNVVSASAGSVYIIPKSSKTRPTTEVGRDNFSPFYSRMRPSQRYPGWPYYVPCGARTRPAGR